MCWIRCRRQPQAKGQMERGDETATSWPCMLLLYTSGAISLLRSGSGDGGPRQLQTQPRERINTHGSVSRLPAVLSGARLLPRGWKGQLKCPAWKDQLCTSSRARTRASGGVHSCRECTEIISTDAILAADSRHILFYYRDICLPAAAGNVVNLQAVFCSSHRDWYRHRDNFRWSRGEKNEDLHRVDVQKFMDS